MDNPLQTLAPPKYELRFFEHPKFGKIRILIIEGEIWFVAADVCRVLELGNVSQAVSRLYDDEKSFVTIPARGIISIDTQGGEQKMLIVNEPGFYRLVFASRKKEALEFQRWVYHEVLPAIRQYGYYFLVAPVVTKHEKNQNRVDGQYTDACVYVAHKKDNFNIVKIGQSKNPKRRLSQIKGIDRDDIFQTSLMSRKDVRALETFCLNYYAPFKLEGEFFCANYHDICRCIKALEKFVAKVKPVSETTINKAITELRTFISDPSVKKLAAPPTK